MMSQEKYIDTEFVSIWLEHGIMNVIWKESKVSYELAESVVKLRLQLSQKNEYPLYVDARKIISIDARTREYLSGVEGTSQAKAAAIHVQNPVTKFLGNIFLNIDNPLRPAALFTNKQKALDWLEDYK